MRHVEEGFEEHPVAGNEQGEEELVQRVVQVALVPQGEEEEQIQQNHGGDDAEEDAVSHARRYRVD